MGEMIDRLDLRPMTDAGLPIPVEIQMKAVMKALPSVHYATIGYRINKLMGDNWTAPWPYARAGDRLTQKLRKHGFIKHERGRWATTPDGWALLEELEHCFG